MSEEPDKRILDEIAALPLEKQTDAIHKLISNTIKQLPIEKIQEIRADIVSQCPTDVAITISTLNLIDGQLALRDIAPKEGWR